MIQHVLRFIITIMSHCERPYGIRTFHIIHAIDNNRLFYHFLRFDILTIEHGLVM